MAVKPGAAVIDYPALLSLLPVFQACAQPTDAETDRKVKEFLNSYTGRNYNMNVPSVDGQAAYRDMGM
jgi:hypothetical protein